LQLRENDKKDSIAAVVGVDKIHAERVQLTEKKSRRGKKDFCQQHKKSRALPGLDKSHRPLTLTEQQHYSDTTPADSFFSSPLLSSPLLSLLHRLQQQTPNGT
jgi:LAS superfamily LD-carboxypeptidase LdcB